MPAVGKGVSVCMGLHVTMSLESVSVHQGGEENSVTKVQAGKRLWCSAAEQSLFVNSFNVYVGLHYR